MRNPYNSLVTKDGRLLESDKPKKRKASRQQRLEKALKRAKNWLRNYQNYFEGRNGDKHPELEAMIVECNQALKK